MDREQILMRFEKLEDELMNHIDTSGNHNSEMFTALLRMLNILLGHVVANNLIDREKAANDVLAVMEKHGKNHPTLHMVLNDYLGTILEPPYEATESETP